MELTPALFRIDAADLMPLKNLHRSQVLQIAAHLGVPDEILARSPNPDIIPGVNDKYMEMLGCRPTRSTCWSTASSMVWRMMTSPPSWPFRSKKFNR